MINQNFHIFGARLSAIEGVNRQSIISWGIVLKEHLTSKNTRHALKQSRVSFFNLTIQSPYRWLVKGLAQLQAILVGSDKCLYRGREKPFLGTFSFSLLLLVFFSLSFRIDIPMRSDI